MRRYVKRLDDIILMTRLLKQIGIKIVAGKVKMSRCRQSADGTHLVKVWETFGSIAKAERMTLHVLENMRKDHPELEWKHGELEKLKRIIDKTQEIYFALSTPDMENYFFKNQDYFCDSLFQLGLSLKLVRDENKKDARDQFRAISEAAGLDSKGRRNPGALSARLVSAMYHLEERTELVEKIIAKYEMRNHLLKELLRLYYLILDNYRIEVTKQINEPCNSELFSLSNLNRQQVEIGLLENVWPYEIISDNLRKNIHVAMSFRNQGKFDDMLECLKINKRYIDQLAVQTHSIRGNLKLILSLSRTNEELIEKTKKITHMCNEYNNSELGPIFSYVKEALKDALAALEKKDRKKAFECLLLARQRVDW